MKRAIIFFLLQYTTFLLNSLEFANALVGRNVRQAQEGEFPNVVCFVRQSQPRVLRYDVKCTGTLITHDHILTSEHCFKNMGPTSLYVLLGNIDLRQARSHYIAWWIFYEQWATIMNKELQFPVNDIAVVKLTNSAPRSITPSLLSPDQNNNLYGLNVFLAGWGKLEDEISPFVLHVVQVTVISNRDCERKATRILGGHIPIHYRYLCTMADPWALLHEGDSGGPMFYGSFLLGINQGTCPRTQNIIDPRKTNLHCTVDFYREFIEHNMIL